MLSGFLLEFLSEAGLRDAQLVAVFCDCTARNLVTFGRHLLHELIVCERLALVLVIHTFLKRLLEFSRRYFLSILVLEAFREEIFKGIYSEMCLDIFAVHDSGNG